MKPTVYIFTVGCSKNQVDSEVMSGILKKQGFSVVDDATGAQVIVVNTCGFIEAAKIESIEAVLELARCKEQGSCSLLIAVGCMVEKFAEEMKQAMPEIDEMMGTGHYQDIGKLINDALELLPDDNQEQKKDHYLDRDLENIGATAYLKIAEGCNNNCSYCLIPQLRGPYISRPKEDILAEANMLYQSGVKELVIIAQDITYYGLDIYGHRKLPELLEKLAEIPFAMIRLLYANPQGIDDRLISVIKDNDNICNYLDMPIQHCSAGVLNGMNRPDSALSIIETVNKLRKAIPDIAIRTTVMVGFPGESEENFNQLIELIDKLQFDWVGSFAYSREGDTIADQLINQIAPDVKQERLDEIRQYSENFSARDLQKYLGQTIPVLVTDTAQEIYGENWFAGRSQYQAPDVDGLIYFSSPTAKIGDIINLKIRACEMFDLIGEVI